MVCDQPRKSWHLLLIFSDIFFLSYIEDNSIISYNLSPIAAFTMVFKYSRVAWAEPSAGFNKFEAYELTIPSCWVQGKKVRWPNSKVANVAELIKECTEPGSRWHSFSLIKVKHEAGEYLKYCCCSVEFC